MTSRWKVSIKCWTSLTLVLGLGVSLVSALAACDGADVAPDVDQPEVDQPEKEAPHPPEVPPSPSDPVEAICAARARWQCGMRAACACPEAGAETDCIGAAAAKCAARVRSVLDDPASEMHIDVARVEACIQAWSVEPVDCGAPANERWDAACGPVLVSKIGLGAACETEGVPCAENEAACVKNLCTALPAEGEACHPVDEAPPCRPGLLCAAGRCRQAPLLEGDACDSSGQCAATLRCVAGTCRPTSALGEACSAERPCRGAAHCLGARCEAGTPDACTEPGEPEVCGVESLCGAPVFTTCTPLAAVGSECSGADTCEAAGYCDLTSYRCEALPESGAPCGEGVFCAPGLGCIMDSRLCAPLPGQGEACLLGVNGPGLCADGLVCVDERCGPIPAEGDTCGYNLECGSGLGCAYEDGQGVCRALREAGGECDNDAICVPGTRCDFGTGRCAPTSPLGAPCVHGNECGAGASCVPTPSGDIVCAPTPTAGQTCLFDCAQGFACVTTRGDFGCFSELCLSLE